MQTQRDVRILGGIPGRAIHIDLIERNLLGALARDIFELNGLDAKISLGGRVHVMAGRNAVEHVRFEHGVVALSRDRDAVVLQHVSVELQAMSHLRPGRVLEQRFECRQHLRPIELVRRSRVVMAERHVGRFPRGDRERQADDARLHVIEAVRQVSKEMSGAAASFASHASSASCERIL